MGKMSGKEKTSGFLRLLTWDKNFWFVVLAAILISLNLVSPVRYNTFYSISSAFAYAFAWVVLAWALTNESIKRKIVPYVAIFIGLVIVEIYWFVFHSLYPYPSSSIGPLSMQSILTGGMGTMQSISLREWWSTSETANYVFIIVEFVVMLVVFISIWYLARPKDFTELKTKTQLLKYKRTILVIISSFLMTMPHWIWRLLSSIDVHINSIELFNWYQFWTYGLPISFALVLFAVVITNLKSKKKYVLLGLVFLFTLIPYIQADINYQIGSVTTFNLYYFQIGLVSYLLVFLSFLLLAKTNYIEQKV
jgi:hypothetical protein